MIKSLAEQIRHSARESDILCRVGGEEFLVLLPGTPLAEAGMIAERLRQNVETLMLPGIQPITISLGVAHWNQQQGEPDKALKRADEALYRAKKEGRNRVVISQ